MVSGEVDLHLDNFSFYVCICSKCVFLLLLLCKSAVMFFFLPGDDIVIDPCGRVSLFYRRIFCIFFRSEIKEVDERQQCGCLM